MLREAYASEAFIEDINFLTINHKGQRSVTLFWMLDSKTNFTTYQDNNEDDVWTKLGGRKDDFYIYDRCGRLTYHISLPYSDIATYNITERALTSTYLDLPCGPCPGDTSSDSSATDQGQGQGQGRAETAETARNMAAVSAVESVSIVEESMGYFARAMNAIKNFFYGSESGQELTSQCT